MQTPLIQSPWDFDIRLIKSNPPLPLVRSTDVEIVLFPRIRLAIHSIGP